MTSIPLVLTLAFILLLRPQVNAPFAQPVTIKRSHQRRTQSASVPRTIPAQRKGPPTGGCARRIAAVHKVQRKAADDDDDLDFSLPAFKLPSSVTTERSYRSQSVPPRTGADLGLIDLGSPLMRVASDGRAAKNYMSPTKSFVRTVEVDRPRRRQSIGGFSTHVLVAPIHARGAITAWPLFALAWTHCCQFNIISFRAIFFLSWVLSRIQLA